MTTAVAKKKPVTKRSQASQSRTPSKAKLETQLKKRLDFIKRMTGRHHHRWIESHPSANLGDLLPYLEGVQSELLDFNTDDVLAEIINELDAAADWLSEWEPVDVHVDGDEPATVELRLGNIEEDIEVVEELIEALGVSFKVKRLPKWKPSAQAA